MRFLLIIGFCFFSTILHAQQTFFNSVYKTNKVHFLYQWKDRHHTLNNVRFALPIAQVQAAQQDFKPFDNALAKQKEFDAILKFKAALEAEGLGVKLINKHMKGFDLNIWNIPKDSSITYDDYVAQFQSIRNAVRLNYIYSQNYKISGKQHVMPDHTKIANAYTAKMAPVAAALAQQSRYAGVNLRAQLNHTLHFLQTIPYDELLNRYTSNGAGFQVPYTLLKKNKGDCDTKSVAFAAIAKNFAPHINIFMVYVPNHAFVALDVPAQTGDVTIQHNGQTLVIADPTGPQQTKLGEPGSQTRNYLSQGKYELVKI